MTIADAQDTAESIRLEPLQGRNRVAFERLLRETWQQNWDDDLNRRIVQWRYYDRPGDAITWLAIDRGRCVAMLDSIVRPYLLDGEPFLVRETADWYCTPDHRPFGVGLWLLRQIGRCPEPIIVLGGSHLTVEILTRLKWRELPCASSYILPVTVRGLLGNLIRQRWWERERMARLIPQFLPARRPRSIQPPLGRTEVRRLAPNEPIEMAPPNQRGLVQLLDTEHWQWLARMPHDLAKPVGLLFSVNGVPVGLSFSQIEPAGSGLDAKIVHLQFRDLTIGAWVVSETCRMLAAEGVGFIRVYVSSEEKIMAVERVGFLKSKDVPCFWSPRRIAMPEKIDVGYLRGDDAMPFQALRGLYAR